MILEDFSNLNDGKVAPACFVNTYLALNIQLSSFGSWTEAFQRLELGEVAIASSLCHTHVTTAKVSECPREHQSDALSCCRQIHVRGFPPQSHSCSFH